MEGCSGRGSEGRTLNAVGGHGRYQVVNRSRSVPSRVRVRVCGSRWGTCLRPLHRLPLDEALADDEVNGGLREGGRDNLAVVPVRRVVRDRGGVVFDVGGQPHLCPANRVRPGYVLAKPPSIPTTTASRATGSWPAVGASSPEPAVSPPRSASCRLATLCRCWRTVPGFVVPATGRTFLGKATVRLKEVRPGSGDAG